MSLERLGSLAELWEGGRPEHLPLLGLQSPDAERIIRKLREIAGRSPTFRDDIQSALTDQDWRPQLVGAVCVGLGLGEARHIDELWEAALHGSWVTPQLLVVASLVDPAFQTRARDAVGVILGSPTAGSLPGGVASAAQHSKQGPSGPAERRGKALSALLALVDPTEPWVRDCGTDPRALAVLKADVDEGGEIARGWRDRLATLR
jgi:hypothetical protein